MSNALAVRKMVEARMPNIVELARSNEEAKQIIGTCFLAIGSSDKLAACDLTSLLGGIYTAVRLGTEVNTPRGLAYFVPRKGRCCFQLGYRGMIDLTYRSISKKVASVNAYFILKGDEFDIQYGTSPRIIHKPAWDSPASKANIIGAYASATMKDSEIGVFTVLNAKDLEDISKSSYTDGDYYKKSYPEWAKARAIKRLMKYLPQDGQLAGAIDTYDERVIELPDVQGVITAAKLDALPAPAPTDIDDAPKTTPEEAAEFAAAMETK
jgi:recombination protein RecT